MTEPSARRRRWLGLLLFPVLILLVALFWFGGRSGAPAPAWASVARGPFSVKLVESGEVWAVKEVIISAPMVWGQNLQVTDLVAEGTRVEAGDFLIQFDNSGLRASATLATDELASLRADLDKRKAEQALRMAELANDLTLARYSHEQALLRLDARQFESAARQEEARLELKQAELDLARVAQQIESQRIIDASQLVKINTEIAQAEGELAAIASRTADLRITAPRAGMVVYQEVGNWSGRERLRKGYTARPGEGLLAIPDLSRMQIELQLNEVDWPRVRVGQQVRITLDAYPETEYHGTIREVAKLAQEIPRRNGLKGFTAYVDITGSDPNLKPGMSARAEILLEELPDALSVPLGTVFELGGQPVVFPRGAGRAHAVYLGPRNDGHVVITRGVRPDMELAWRDPSGEAHPLGAAAEAERIAAARRVMRASFSVLARRGILYDYLRAPGEEDSSAAGEGEDAEDQARREERRRAWREGRRPAEGGRPARPAGGDTQGPRDRGGRETNQGTRRGPGSP